MPDRQLIIHAGLPKTGTTSLQRSVFPHLECYLGGSEPGGHDQNLATELRSQFQGKAGHPDFESREWRHEIREWWARVEGVLPDKCFVSLEALFRWFDPVSGHPWPLMGDGKMYRSERHGRHPLVDFTSALVEEIGAGRIRLILTLRNQADFAISHYAQLSYRMLGPSQADFQEKIRVLLDSPDPFFDWYATVAQLLEIVEPRDLLCPIFEDGLESVAERIIDFVGEPLVEAVPTRSNVRSSSGGWEVDVTSRSTFRTWSRRVWPTDRQPKVRRVVTRPLRGLAGIVPVWSKPSTNHIKFPATLRGEFQASFRQSNDRLAGLLKRDLAQLGY